MCVKSLQKRNKHRKQLLIYKQKRQEFGGKKKSPAIWGLRGLEEANTSLSPKEKMKVKIHLRNDV